MSEYEGVIAIILLTAVVIALIGVMLSAFVVAFFALREAWNRRVGEGEKGWA